MEGHATPDEILHPAAPALVLCPLGFERRAFTRYGKLPVVTTGPGPAAMHRAFAERDRWPVRNPRLVVLLGLAGALRQGLRAGDAARVATVVDATGATLFRSPLAEAEASVVEWPSPVASVADKQAVAARTRADLVDMESHAFAQCAAEARLPWAIVRGISDDAGRALPDELAGFVDDRGETRTARVLAAIARRPALLAAIAAIGRDARAAMRNASFEADALGCLEGIDLCRAANPLLLFGGSFDPPHARHATLLAEAMRSLHAASALVVPAAVNPLKSGSPPADPSSRLAMCRAAFGGGSNSFPAEVRLSHLELDREGPSYTVDTVASLIRRRPRLAGAVRFLVGSDAMRTIGRWHRWRELVEIARPAVVLRPPDTRESVGRFLEDLADSSGLADAPSWLLDLPPVDLASTGIREAIARGQRPDGLADGVWREITARGLYSCGGAG